MFDDYTQEPIAGTPKRVPLTVANDLNRKLFLWIQKEMTTHFQWPHGKCLQVRGWVNQFNGVVLWHVTRLFQTLGLTSNQTELETKSQWFQVRFLRLNVRCQGTKQNFIYQMMLLLLSMMVMMML